MKKFKKNMEGFTLLEVIISLAIIGILAVAFLSTFSTGFNGIARAGRMNKDLFTAQDNVENVIAGNTITDAVSSTGQLTITFSTGAVQVEGEYVNSGTINVFVPESD